MATNLPTPIPQRPVEDPAQDYSWIDEYGNPRSFSGTAVDAAGNRIVRNVNNPTVPAAARQTYTQQQRRPEEMVTGAGSYITGTNNPAAQQGTVAAGPNIRGVTVPGVQAALTNSASTQAAQGDISAESQMDAAQARASRQSQVRFQYTPLPDRATVQGQLAQLLTGMEDGEIPAWARPAVDIANNMLAERGVGRSSVARDTLYNAIIQSALPIASADSQAFQQEWLQNMSAKERATMFNATTAANIDIKNADYIQQANQQIAQAFLQMDFENLSNEQRTNEINMQARQQALISNQAAANSARQFNATNSIQVQEFMSQLAAQVGMNNAARVDAMRQFNAGARTNMAQFNAQLNFNRQQFNATMGAQIEQANVNWTRQVNTANTAGINAANQANAINMFNLSAQAMQTIMQEQRDAANWVWTANQNEVQRATQLAMAALTNESVTDEDRVRILSSLGQAALNLFNSSPV